MKSFVTHSLTNPLLFVNKSRGAKWQSIILALLITVFAAFLLTNYHWQHAALAFVAVALGVVFYRCQFGFASTWRALILRGDGSGLRAQMLWIILAALPFALLTGAGDVLPAQATANVRPLTMAIVAGAFIFGIGMQLGGACTSGSIVGVGSGNGVPVLSLIGFVVGALWAAVHIEFWNELPAYAAFSFYQEWGLGGAVVLMLMAAAVALATRWLPQNTPVESSRSLSLYRGAIYISLLSVLILILGKQPWGLINGFTIAGGKALVLAGHEDIIFWEFWTRYANGEEVLEQGWFAGSQMVTTVAMLLGVALAAAFAGELKSPLRRYEPKRLLLSIAGGVMMGYGAQISYGCNIGSYVSALSSGSAHGWLWLLAAFGGAAVGVAVRKVTGLEK